MERNGVVYGYMETIIIPVEENGKQLIRLEESIKSMSSLMGAPVNNTIKAESLLDPEQKKLISQDFLMDQGSTKLEISISIKGDKAYITQNMGGSFGQHGWNEVYMGEAGWIPLDTTLREIDFVDSSHIRLGILESEHIAFNPDNMEILDFHAGSQRFGQAASTTVPEKFKPYIGQYPVPMQEGMFTVFFSHNNLAVKHPAGRILYLEEPDEQGQWACRNREDKISFVKDDEGRVKFMIIHEQVHAPKINKK